MPGAWKDLCRVPCKVALGRWKQTLPTINAWNEYKHFNLQRADEDHRVPLCSLMVALWGCLHTYRLCRYLHSSDIKWMTCAGGAKSTIKLKRCRAQDWREARQRSPWWLTTIISGGDKSHSDHDFAPLQILRDYYRPICAWVYVCRTTATQSEFY